MIRKKHSTGRQVSDRVFDVLEVASGRCVSECRTVTFMRCRQPIFDVFFIHYLLDFFFIEPRIVDSVMFGCDVILQVSHIPTSALLLLVYCKQTQN